MAKAFIVSGGNGGDTSDDCTATALQVLEDYKAITKESDSDVVSGTMKNLTKRSTIKHTSTNITPVVLGDAALMTTNSDGVSRTQIRHNGENGYIQKNTLLAIETSKMATAGSLTAAKLLAGQSAFGISGTATNDATATDPYVHSGKTYYSKGVKRTGTMTISSVVSFSVAAYSTKQLLCTWKNPAKGPYSGVIIRYKTGSYPSSVSDGTLGYQGAGTNHALNASNSAFISGLNAGTQYYVRIWMYCNTSIGVLYSGYASSSGAIKTTNSGRQVFTGSGTFVVPAGVRDLNVCVVGAGGSTYTKGTDRHQDDISKGAAGGYVVNTTIGVTPGQQFPVVVGAPITPKSSGDGTTITRDYWRINLHPSNGNPPSNTLADFQNHGVMKSYTTNSLTRGGSSSFGNIIAQGGTGHYGLVVGPGLPGGSGSGALAGYVTGSSSGGSHGSGAPGSNGGNGGDARGYWYSHDSSDAEATYHFGGPGQGTSTREFGTGTLYATAGVVGVRRTAGTPGGDNTGNGASGAGGYSISRTTLGGSGVVVVTW